LIWKDSGLEEFSSLFFPQCFLVPFLFSTTSFLLVAKLRTHEFLCSTDFGGSIRMIDWFWLIDRVDPEHFYKNTHSQNRFPAKKFCPVLTRRRRRIVRDTSYFIWKKKILWDSGRFLIGAQCWKHACDSNGCIIKRKNVQE